MAYQIKISICNIKPEIWRRLKIPGNITFAQLHRIIQMVFGWQDYHLYNFQFEDSVIAIPDPHYAPGGLYGEDKEELDSAVTNISKYFDKHDKCIYEYDFGDSWDHEIIVEKRLKNTKSTAVPVCLDGARSRPPEDVGGVGGYENFLTIIKDKKNPEREEYLDWARKDTKGKLFDPEYFYADEVNGKLLHVLDDTPESSADLFKGKDGFKGELKFGFSGPYIETDKDKYTWDRIGDLLMWIDDGYDISIKVGGRKRGRR